MKSKRMNALINTFAKFLGRFSSWFGRGKGSAVGVDTDVYSHQRSHVGTRARRKGRKRLGKPAFEPGTITYFDWLVRELGYDRRLADGYMYAYLNGYRVKMPMPSDLKAA